MSCIISGIKFNIIEPIHIKGTKQRIHDIEFCDGFIISLFKNKDDYIKIFTNSLYDGEENYEIVPVSSFKSFAQMLLYEDPNIPTVYLDPKKYEYKFKPSNFDTPTIPDIPEIMRCFYEERQKGYKNPLTPLNIYKSEFGGDVYPLDMELIQKTILSDKILFVLNEVKDSVYGNYNGNCNDNCISKFVGLKDTGNSYIRIF